MRDKNGKLVNAAIHPRGQQQTWFEGWSAEDVHYWINEPDKSRDDEAIYVCEGWATGEPIFQATGNPVILAFNATNLPSVASWVHKRYPTHDIIVAVDDDWKEKDNPGLSIGRQAARLVGGRMVMPSFDENTSQEEGLPTSTTCMSPESSKRSNRRCSMFKVEKMSEDDQAIHQQAKRADTLIA